MIETANQKHDNAEHYTDQGHVVDRLFTELNTVNQPSETDQSVLGSDHRYFQIEGIEMTSFTKTEMSTMTKWKEKEQACPTKKYTLYRVTHDKDDSKQMNTMNLNR